jgi:RNA polymerase sigma-70 factor (ECF subfamily)
LSPLGRGAIAKPPAPATILTPSATPLAATPPEAVIDPDEANFLSHLLAESGDGDARAFATLYRCTAARLYPLALKLKNDQTEADALLVNTFLHVWTDADRYHPSRIAALDWMIALLYQLAGNPSPPSSDEPWPELPPPDGLWLAIHARIPDDSDDTPGLRWPLIIASVVGILIGAAICLSLLLELRPGS